MDVTDIERGWISGFMSGAVYSNRKQSVYETLDSCCQTPPYRTDDFARRQTYMEMEIKKWWACALDRARLRPKIQGWVWSDREMFLECAGHHDLRDWLAPLLPEWPDDWSKEGSPTPATPQS